MREFLEKSKSHVFNVAGVTIAIKKAMTKINAARNWALREAHTKITALDVARGAEVKIEWTERCVKHGADVVFTQTPGELKGTFSGIAAALILE